MKRKKIRATKKNKEKIKGYKVDISLDHFLGIERLKLTCSKCKRDFVIRSHNPELYTEEVRKNYVCLLCKK